MKKIFFLLLSCMITKSYAGMMFQKFPQRHLGPLAQKRTEDFGQYINESIDARHVELDEWKKNNHIEFTVLKRQEIARLEKEIADLEQTGRDIQKIAKEKAVTENARVKTSESPKSDADKSISDLRKDKKNWENLLKNEQDHAVRAICKNQILRIDGEIKKITEPKKQPEQKFLRQKTDQENALQNSISFDPRETIAQNFLGNTVVRFKTESSAGKDNNCLIYSIYRNHGLLEQIVGPRKAAEILSFRGAESSLDLQCVRKAIFDRMITRSREGFTFNVFGESITIEGFLEGLIRKTRGNNPHERLKNWLNDLLRNKAQIPTDAITVISHMYRQSIWVFKEMDELEWTGSVANIEEKIGINNALIPCEYVEPFLRIQYHSFQEYLKSEVPSIKEKIEFVENIEGQIPPSADNTQILRLLTEIKTELKKPFLVRKKIALVNGDSYDAAHEGKEPILVYFSGGSSCGHYEKLKRLPD